VSLCAATATAVIRLGLTVFTLAWTHTVEHTRWEEDWRVSGGRLMLLEARVQGSGAGMDPGPDATFDPALHMWRWHPRVAPLPEIIPRRAPQAGDWQICEAGRCRALGDLVPDAGDNVRLYPCSD
jgi:hypothetical protein